MVIERALTNLVAVLVERERLVLNSGATVHGVVAELLEALHDQPAFGQVGPFVSSVLLESLLVDELFADDREIVELVSEVG